ncbi:MAG TPA: YgiQ family radical SAM protein, partial [Candidatus Rifleibacterium sp.]|nr:YgiQ family radical SAM protein [Candidatus Rifleibacterium sp.]
MPWYAYPALAFRGRKYLPDRSATNVFDVIVVSGDAYVDHPAFPAAVITRLLQRLGLKVAVIAQPDWNSDSDFLVWGRPELFFAVVPGAMDSMVANYTASRMPRGRDRLSPDGEPGLRPKRALQIYVQKIRQLFRDAGLVIGGIEASLRRFAHYDFWEDRLRDPILVDTPADILVYGMAEPVIEKVVDWYKAGRQPAIPQIPQTAMRVKHDSWREWLTENFLLLPSVDECRQNAEAFMNMTRITDSSVRPGGKSLVQQHPKGDIICFPPSAADYLAETTIIGQLPYNRRSHPIYENPVPGLEPVQFSVQSHRGCLGACSFCALSLHQGRTIRSRTPASILAELASFAEHPDFKGIVPDIGGPAVNMYGWECRAGGCERNMCTHPVVCRNVLTTLRPLAELLKAAVAVPGIRRVFLGSGLRYDLIRPEEWDLFEYIIFNHISGQLKVAPEHFDKKVLGLMRKGESEQVISTFQDKMKMNLIFVDASQRFLSRLAGVADPEAKRKIIGEEFIRVFEEEKGKLGEIDYLVQGTIYPDVIESGTSTAHTIKSHHNVGGLPEDIDFALLEPLRLLFKDEVRLIGEKIGLGAGLIWRQPFPGPGLGVRVLEEVTAEKLALLR